MEETESETKTILQILGEKYLSRFTVYHPETLFPPHWPALLDSRCPLCGNKLKWPIRMKHNRTFICSGVSHGKTFVIKGERLDQIKAKFIPSQH